MLILSSILTILSLLFISYWIGYKTKIFFKLSRKEPELNLWLFKIKFPILSAMGKDLFFYEYQHLKILRKAMLFFLLSLGATVFYLSNIFLTNFKYTNNPFYSITNSDKWLWSISEAKATEILKEKTPNINEDIMVFRTRKKLQMNEDIYVIPLNSILKSIAENPLVNKLVAKETLSLDEYNSIFTSDEKNKYSYEELAKLNILSIEPNLSKKIVISRIEKLNFYGLNFLLRQNIDTLGIFKINAEQLKEHQGNIYNNANGYYVVSKILGVDLSDYYYSYKDSNWLLLSIWYAADIVYYAVILFFMFSAIKYLSWKERNIVKPVDKSLIDYVSFWGNEHLKKLFDEMICLYKNNKSLKSLKGVLLYWPPWCGKTLFAQYLAKKLDFDLYQVSAGSFKSKWHWGTEKNIKHTYESIREKIKRSNKQAIIFMDELDSIGGHRDETHEATQGGLNELLTQMDGFIKDNIILIGATNRLEKIDEALLSRFNEKILVWYPNYQERVEIITNHLKYLYDKKTNDGYVNLINEEEGIQVTKEQKKPFFSKDIFKGKNLDYLTYAMMSLTPVEHFKETISYFYEDFLTFCKNNFNEELIMEKEDLNLNLWDRLYTVNDFLFHLNVIRFQLFMKKNNNRIEVDPTSFVRDNPVYFANAINGEIVYDKLLRYGNENHPKYKEKVDNNALMFVEKQFKLDEEPFDFYDILIVPFKDKIKEIYESNKGVVSLKILEAKVKAKEEVDKESFNAFVNAMNTVIAESKEWYLEAFMQEFTMDGEKKLKPFMKKSLIETIKIIDKEIIDNPTILIENMAYIADNFSGRKIGQLIDAMYTQAIMYRKKIDFDLFWTAIENILLGRDKPTKFNQKTLEIIAYHEMWHAIIWKLIGKELLKVTVGARGNALWVTYSIDKEQETTMLRSEEDIINNCKQLVAGKMAEQLFIGSVTTGSSNDYERVYHLLAFLLFSNNLSYTIKNGINSWKVLKMWFIKPFEKYSDSEKALLSQYVKDATIDIEEDVKMDLYTYQDKIHFYAKRLLEEKIIDWKEIILE